MANIAASGTLVATVVTTVTLNEAHGKIRVIMRSASPADIFFTVASSGQTPPAPTVGGNDCYCLPGVVGEQFEVEVGQQPVTVSLISAGTPSFTVEADDPDAEQV